MRFNSALICIWAIPMTNGCAAWENSDKKLFTCTLLGVCQHIRVIVQIQSYIVICRSSITFEFQIVQEISLHLPLIHFLRNHQFRARTSSKPVRRQTIARTNVLLFIGLPQTICVCKIADIMFRLRFVTCHQLCGMIFSGCVFSQHTGDQSLLLYSKHIVGLHTVCSIAI